MPICPVCVTYWDPKDGHADCPGRTITTPIFEVRQGDPDRVVHGVSSPGMPSKDYYIPLRTLQDPSPVLETAPKIEGEWIGELPANAPDLCPKCGAYWKCDCFDAVKYAIESEMDRKGNLVPKRLVSFPGVFKDTRPS